MPAPLSPPVRLEWRDDVAEIVLDRAPLNVLDIDMVRQLNAAIVEVGRKRAQAMLLRSALDRAFSAGVEVRDHTAERVEAMLDAIRENARLLLEMKAITIAAIHGSTLGGGAELALLCDLVIAADDTTFRLPEISLAAFPPIAAAILLERCNSAAAFPLLLGEAVDADALVRLGLASTVVPGAQLGATARRQAEAIAGYSAVALQALIQATRGAKSQGILQRIDAAIAVYKAMVATSSDAREGIDAFLQKRPAVWSHR